MSQQQKPVPLTIETLNNGEQVKQLFYEWAHREGWQPGTKDLEPFFEIDHNGFFVGKVQENEHTDPKIVSIVSGVSYDKDYGFIGFYVVDPEERGKNYGYPLFRAAMDYLGEERTIGLEAVSAQAHNYEKCGFVTLYTTRRYWVPASDIVKHKTEENTGDIRFVQAQGFPIEQLVKYDSEIFGHERARYLTKLFQVASSSAVVMKEDKIVGYGAVRPADGVYKVGPLFADSVEIAEQLLIELSSSLENHEWNVCLDIHVPNHEAIQLAEEKLKATVLFETGRMYRRGKNQPEPSDAQSIPRMFMSTSLEIG